MNKKKKEAAFCMIRHIMGLRKFRRGDRFVYQKANTGLNLTPNDDHVRLKNVVTVLMIKKVTTRGPETPLLCEGQYRMEMGRGAKVCRGGEGGRGGGVVGGRERYVW